MTRLLPLERAVYRADGLIHREALVPVARGGEVPESGEQVIAPSSLAEADAELLCERVACFGPRIPAVAT